MAPDSGLSEMSLVNCQIQPDSREAAPVKLLNSCLEFKSIYTDLYKFICGQPRGSSRETQRLRNRHLLPGGGRVGHVRLELVEHVLELVAVLVLVCTTIPSRLRA